MGDCEVGWWSGGRSGRGQTKLLHLQDLNWVTFDHASGAIIAMYVYLMHTNYGHVTIACLLEVAKQLIPLENYSSVLRYWYLSMTSCPC